MRKYQILIATILLAISGILIFSNTARYELTKRINIISAGSYAFSESYEFPYSEARVIKAIENFKEKNPKYQVPEVSIFSNNSFKLEDSKSENGL
ncbi:MULTISPECIES: hypothetical protein [unclassified Flavobacterium]|uniref:hypothetical protein n=1 Tax=unclassified Flavobacterium TaxID=196869 RepID=UPI00131BECDA|nr:MULTISPECIES: hypothetical protein [unclassified Flavobacterium]